MSSHNELNRRLKDSDPHVRYSIIFLYEQMVDIQKQLDQVTSVMLQFADQLEGFVRLNAHTDSVLQNMRKGNTIVDGVSVYSESVLDEPKE